MGNKNYEIKNREYNGNTNNDFEERGNIYDYDEEENYETYETEAEFQSQYRQSSPKGDQFVSNLFKLFIFLFLAIFGTGGFIAYKYLDEKQKKEEEEFNNAIKNEIKPQELFKNVLPNNIKETEIPFDVNEAAKRNKIRIVNGNTSNNEYKTPKSFTLIKNNNTHKETNPTKTNADKSFEENKLKEFKKKFIDKKENKSKFEQEFIPTVPREATGPKKDIANYYFMSEEQLIKEVNDSFETDYDYYIRGTKYNRGQVKATLTTITQQNNYLKLLELLLTKGFATNFMGQNEDFDILSMTYYHAVSDNREYLEILLKHGGDLKSEQYDGMTILHAAAMNNNIELAKRVLDAGVPIDKKNKSGQTPLYFAIKNNCYDMVIFLVEKGAKIEDEYKEITNDRNILGFLASSNNKSENNDKNASFSFPENKDWEEAFEYIKNGDIDSLKVLESSGQDLSQMFYDGEPAPCIAVKYGRTEIFKYITNKFDCSKLVDKINGRNVLHYTVMYYKPEMLKYLLRNNYNPNVQDNLGNTPLHYAAENPYPDYCRYLLKYGANTKILNNKKRNPLFFAVNTENTSEFENLIEKGADIDQQDSEGNTPLHYSINKNLVKSTEKLLQLGANKDITNLNNQTPMDLANLKNNTEIIKLFDRYKYKVLKVAPHNEFAWSDKVDSSLPDIVRHKFLTNDIRTNTRNLLKYRDTLLEMPENRLLYVFNTIEDFKKSNAKSKTRAETNLLDIETLVFLKIALDKDYPDLFNKILEKYPKFLAYWKINYVPILFYVADKDSKKCLDVLFEKNVNLKTELTYKIGRPYDINHDSTREDRKTLYLMRRLTTTDNFTRWGEIILNLDKDVFEPIADDDEIEYDLDIGKTLLHSAAQNGNISFANKVLEAGVPLDKTTKKGFTPLYYAVKNNQYEIAEFLVKKGANVDQKGIKEASDNKMQKILKINSSANNEVNHE